MAPALTEQRTQSAKGMYLSKPKPALRLRSELISQMSDLFRAIPHRPGCPRQPPFEGNVQCKCDVADLLREPGEALTAVIYDATKD